MMRTTLKQSDTSQEEKQDSPENKDLPPDKNFLKKNINKIS